MSDQIYFFDTTLRDGEQCPGASMNLREKLEVARQMERLGMDVIEASPTATLKPCTPSPAKSKNAASLVWPAA